MAPGTGRLFIGIVDRLIVPASGARYREPVMPFHGQMDLMSAIKSLWADVIARPSLHADDRQPPTACYPDPATEPIGMGCRNDREEAA
jgi:hypothetical protein